MISRHFRWFFSPVSQPWLHGVVGGGSCFSKFIYDDFGHNWGPAVVKTPQKVSKSMVNTSIQSCDHSQPVARLLLPAIAIQCPTKHWHGELVNWYSYHLIVKSVVCHWVCGSQLLSNLVTYIHMYSNKTVKYMGYNDLEKGYKASWNIQDGLCLPSAKK